MKEIKTYTERCPYCGKEHVQSMHLNIICPCGAKYYFNTHEWLSRKPQTNADRIRAMSDEELAAFRAGGHCPPSKRFPNCATIDPCSKCWLDYLRQPVKDGEEE